MFSELPISEKAIMQVHKILMKKYKLNDMTETQLLDRHYALEQILLLNILAGDESSETFDSRLEKFTIEVELEFITERKY